MKKKPSYVCGRICSNCGGDCCRTFPGSAMPEDFGAPNIRRLTKNLELALRSGNWAVDTWFGSLLEDEQDDEFYYVRPHMVNKAGKGVFDISSWGWVACVFHTPRGCAIFENRPSGCRGVRPRSDRRCEVKHSSKEDAAKAWFRYSKILTKIAQQIDNTEG